MRITLNELRRMGIYWSDICNVTGGNEWAVNEGLLSDDDQIELSIEDAYRIGIIAKEPRYSP